MFAYSKLIIDNIAKNDGNLMIFRKRRKEEKLAGSARDGVTEMFDVFAETASGVTAREQRAGKQNKNDKAFHHL